MRKFKGFVAAALALCMLISLTTALAADTPVIENGDKAATLKDLGLYAGTDATDPAAGLDGRLTTQDSLLFLAKLFGYNEAANAMSDSQVNNALARFEDGNDVSNYAKNVVAYSADNGIIYGSQSRDRLFLGAQDTVTANRLAAFTVRGLGYQVPDYQKAVAQLAEIPGSQVPLTLIGDLTRDDAVSVLYGALTAEKASGNTVIQDLVRDSEALSEIAEHAGILKEFVNLSVTVESVRTLNLKQLKIVFDRAMDKASAEDESFYSIQLETTGGTELIELGEHSASLSEDQKSVKITLGREVSYHLSQGSYVSVVVKAGIRAADGRVLPEDDIVSDLFVTDLTIPSVLQAEAVGEKRIKLTLSEPVFDGSGDTNLNTNLFQITSGTYIYYIQRATLDLDAIYLEVGTKLVEGPVTVTVYDKQADSIRDYAGYRVPKSSITFNYVKDTSVSVVTVPAATSTAVTLAFSKPVKFTDLSLYHTAPNLESGFRSQGSTGSDYRYQWTFSFSGESALPAGTVTLYLVNDVNDSHVIMDGYGIKVPNQTLIFQVSEEEEVTDVDASEAGQMIVDEPGYQMPTIFIPGVYPYPPINPYPDYDKPILDGPGEELDGPGEELDGPGEELDGPGQDFPGQDFSGQDFPG